MSCASAALALCAASPLAAGERMQVTGLACETTEQVRQVFDLIEGGIPNQEAMMMVNMLHDTPDAIAWACARATRFIDRKEKVDKIETSVGLMEIYAADIIAFVKNGLWVPATPTKKYFPFLAEKSDHGSSI